MKITKKQMTETIREIVAKYKMHQEFESDYIKNILQTRHYFLKAHPEYVPIKFKKVPYMTGYSFEAFFENIGWHGISWVKAVNLYSPIDNIKQMLSKALRITVESQVRFYKNIHNSCERCGNSNSPLEVDHVNPIFDVLVTDFINTVDKQYLQQLAESHDWLKVERFELPESDYVTKFREIHSKCTLQVVCHECHLQNARDRKQ